MSETNTKLAFPTLARMAAMLCLALLFVPFALRSAEEKRLAVYAEGSQFFIPITDIEQREYVAVEDLLAKLGQVAKSARKDAIRIRFRGIEGDFPNGGQRFRIGRTTINSTEPVIVQEGTLLMPVSVLPLVLKNYGLGEADLHQAGRRLFLAGAKQQVEHALHAGEPSSLTFDFPAAVNPNVSSDGNRIHFVFRKEPVVWGADRVDYTDKLIRSVAFAEANGQSELTVQGSAPLLATFSNGGKTITITAAPAPVVAKAPAETPAVVPPVTTPPAETTAPTPSTETAPALDTNAPATPTAHFYVLIDAAHGGDEPGVKFSDKLTEKEISLLLAQRLRTELQDRGVTAVMVRNDDTTVSLEARAVIANEKRAGMYISLHAGGPGTGVRVYTALMGAEPKTAASPLFVPWEQAQRPYLGQSSTVANALVTEFGSRKIDAAMMPAPIAPLPSIAAPAIAIEVAPPASKRDPEGLRLAAYQKAIAEAAAKAIVTARVKLSAGGSK